jgi:hypothetical protein
MTERKALKLIVYDRTCRGPAGLGLSTAWRGGTRLYGALGRSDGSFGAASFSEALAWVASYRTEHPIAELQYWGHGKWGRVFVAGESLDERAFSSGQAHHTALERVRARLTANALVWFRTCETLGADSGHRFARRCADFFGCAVAGHTFVIGYWQSGLHRLAPGNTPHWSATEGLREGSAAAPRRAASSRPGRPQTISCLSSHVPATW